MSKPRLKAVAVVLLRLLNSRATSPQKLVAIGKRRADMTEKKPSLFLRNCKICKHDVAWNAKKCLNCGVANPTTTWKHNLIAFVLVMLAVGYCATPSDKATTAETKTANSGQSSSIEAPDESTPVSNITEDSTAINEEENQPLSFEEYAMGYTPSFSTACHSIPNSTLVAWDSREFFRNSLTHW
jgi:hypothetical protein